MNWKTELEKMLAHRKRMNNAEKYLKVLIECILPAFKEIEKILYEHNVISTIINDDELKVDGCGFIMKVEIAEDKIKIIFRYLDPLEPIDMPPPKDSVEKYIAVKEVTQDMIGEEFIEAFKPMLKYYTLSTE